MDIQNLSKCVYRYLLLLCCLLLSALMLERSIPQTYLEKVIETGELRVISRNGATTYYEGANGLTGYGYKLVKGFANQLGVELVVINESQSPFARLLQGQEDLVATAITQAEADHLPLRFTEPHRQIQFQLIGHADDSIPALSNVSSNPSASNADSVQLTALAGLVIMLTPEMAQHPAIQTLQKHYPQIQWQESDNNDATDLLAGVHRGQIPLALIDSDTYLLNQYSFVNAQVMMNLGEPQDLAWAFADKVDDSLYQAAQSYIERIKQSGHLAKITAEFFQANEDMNSVDAVLLSQHLEERLLPHLEDMKRASEEFNLDWRLLAAIGYKESQWLTDIESPTGVKGMMMLTKVTAKAMGVRDRENPQQAIFGAAKLFRYLLDNQPASIQGEERVHFALACYNQGMGHIEDARKLTQASGGNPNRWQDVREHLPLLSLSRYHSKARHGYMRGKEPVVFVDKVWDYYKMLVWHEQQAHLRLATASSHSVWL